MNGSRKRSKNLNKTSDRLLRLRKAAGFTQAEAAEAIGIDSSYISLIERGKKEPSVLVQKAIERLEDEVSGRGVDFPMVSKLNDEEDQDYAVSGVAVLRRVLNGIFTKEEVSEIEHLARLSNVSLDAYVRADLREAIAEKRIYELVRKKPAHDPGHS